MKYSAIAFAVLVLLAPLGASAHERRTIEIGGVAYQFVVGSLGEPLMVDDKSGVDFWVSDAAGQPVLGLEEQLEVEIQGDGQSKRLPLATVYGAPGSYKAVFYPTKAVQLKYRFLGTMNGTPIDISFACMPGGHVMGGEDNTTRVELGQGVVQTLQAGQFGCPQEKDDLGFPVASVSLDALRAERAQMQQLVWAALGLAIVALGVGFVRRR